jgi:site-specific recombinase XerD
MSPTLKDHLYARGLSKSTVEYYYQTILSFISWLDVQNVEAESATASDVLGWMQHLKQKGYSNPSRAVRLNMVRHFFDYQIACGKRVSNPATHLKIRGSHTKKLYPVLSKEELENIYHQYALASTEHPRAKMNWYEKYTLSRQRNKTILGLMVWQGLTTAEVNKLSPADIHLKEGKIYITGGRKSAERTLELKPWQILELMQYEQSTRVALLAYHPEQADKYYPRNSMSKNKVLADGEDSLGWKALSKEVKKYASRFIHFKQVRTSVITHWLKQYNLRQVQYLAGHKYLSTTEGYIVNQIEDLQQDIEKYHPI